MIALIDAGICHEWCKSHIVWRLYMFSAVKNSLISNEVVSFQETPWMSALRSWFFHTTFKMLENGSQTVEKCLNLIYTHRFRSWDSFHGSIC